MELISLGVVDEDGRTFYGVSNQFNLQAARANTWLRDNVLEKLPPESEWQSLDLLRKNLLEFLGDEPAHPHYYFIEQDAVLLRYLLSDRFLDKPANIVEPFRNIAQRFNDMGAPREIIPPNPNIHDALSDAIWTKAFDEAMDAYENNDLI